MRPHAALMRDAPATVFLAVPHHEMGGPSSGADLARHRSVAGAPVIDEHTGDDPLRIPRVVPSARLIVAAEPPPRFVCLPIAKVRLDGEAFVRTDYVPPLLGVPLASPIGEICQRISVTLREKAQRLSSKVLMRSRTTDRERIAEERAQIQCLVAALPPFEALLNSDRPHPFSLFLALAALVGQLSSLSRSHLPPLLPSYRHDELRVTFEDAFTHLFRMIEEGIIESFNAYPFDLIDGRYRVMFHREFRDKVLVLQARTRRASRDADLRAWVESSLMCSNDKLQSMKESRILGAGRQKIDRQGELVASEGTLLFALEGASPYLESNELFVVTNVADPSAQRGPLELVLYVKSE
jgi:type VI secretion system protein ImpJ